MITSGTVTIMLEAIGLFRLQGVFPEQALARFAGLATENEVEPAEIPGISTGSTGSTGG